DLRTRGDADNTEMITVNRMGNKWKAHVPQAQEKLANNLGRGMTSPIFQIDEGPFQRNIAIALPAALAASAKAVTQAIENDTPYGTIMTTTAGKKNDPDGAYVYEMIEESAQWTEKLYDCKNREELERVVRGSSRKKLYQIHANFNHIQLGKDDQWLYETIQRVKSKGEAADRDFFNRWTSGSKSMPFSIELAERAAKSEMEPLYVDISKPDGYVTRWFIPESQIEHRMQSSKFVMGKDTSDASNGDDISMIIVDIETGETVAAGTFNNTNLTPYFRWVASILVNYKNVTAIIERRSTGAALLDALLWILPQHGEDPFKRIFNFVVNDYLEYPDRYKEINMHVNRRPSDIYVRYKKTFGFPTSASGVTSRTALYSETLTSAMQRSSGKMRDATLIKQTLGLVVKDGRVDHMPGEHDDMVIGWLLCHWFMTKATNLAYYGIDSRTILAKAQPVRILTQAEQHALKEQERVRAEIETLYKRLQRENDDFVCMRIEHMLKSLSMKIESKDEDA